MEGEMTIEVSETVEAFCSEIHPQLEAIVHKYCDEAYCAIMETVQDYLRENVTSNLKSKFDAQQREVVSAYKALAACENAATLREAHVNARAARKGYWTEERSAQYREDQSDAP